MCLPDVFDTGEPDTGWTPPAEDRSCPLLGYADIHAHLGSEAAHGFRVNAGTAAPYEFDPSGVGGTYRLGSGFDIRTALSPDEDNSVHGQEHLGGLVGALATPHSDTIGKGVNDRATDNYGYPLYNHWPHWSSATHQQMYYKWLERAYRGGLRLMVQLAVTNEALCMSKFPVPANPEVREFCGNSQLFIDVQLARTYAFEEFIDSLHGGDGWFRIVTTPAEARSVIANNKMAVVLGIEMDKLFNCSISDADNCPNISHRPELTTLDEALDFYYASGVRHVFPVHNFDNAFGATATWQDAINAGQAAATGVWQSTRDCHAQGYGYGFDPTTQNFIDIFGFGNIAPPAPDYDEAAVCSSILPGITALGQQLLNGMMDRGMIIDVDHLSAFAFDETVELTGARSYPIVASHVQPFALHEQDLPGLFPDNPITGRHERMRTPDDLIAIRDSGGMIAAMTKDDQQDGGGGAGRKFHRPYNSPLHGGLIADNCRHSSRTYAQAFQYAVDLMGAPVALGIDFNGIAGHVGPRFGSEACGICAKTFGDGTCFSPFVEPHDERSAQIRFSQKMEYDFTLPGFGTFERQTTNARTWDFNNDGLAHAGLLPDLVEDLKTVGLNDTYIDALFNSAQEYIRVWELAEARANGTDPPEPLEELSCPDLCLDPDSDETPPPITCTDVETECTGEETLVPDFVQAGEDNCGGAVNVECDETGLFGVGPTTSTCTATDDAGNESECHAEITVTDSTKPSSVKAPPDLSEIECTSPEGASPALGVATASDLCDPSPMISNDAPSVFPLDPPTTIVTWTARDDSGNEASALQSVTVVDTSPPTNTCPADVTIECDASREPSNTGSATAADTCDSAPEVASSDADVGGACADESVITRTWSATDAAGNAAEDCDQTILVVDTTAPVIACNAPATIDPTQGLDEDDPLAAPISFTATAPDNCDPNASVEVVGFDCFAFTKKGKRIDKTESCVAAIQGDTFTILDSGGVGDTITWTVRATDRCGEVSETVCEVGVVKPTIEP
jgi:microsomal dipeptidase-like Zn-dependent dipeptidase